MNPIAYLTTPDALFGWIEWFLFISQIVLLLVGAYFAFVHRTANAIQFQALQRFGYVLLTLGALGSLLGLLKLNVFAPFNTRLWLALIVLFEIVLGIYALIYSRTTYREQVAAAATRRSTRPSATRKAVTSTATPSAPRPVEVSVPRIAPGRRDARRKRKKR